MNSRNASNSTPAVNYHESEQSIKEMKPYVFNAFDTFDLVEAIKYALKCVTEKINEGLEHLARSSDSQENSHEKKATRDNNVAQNTSKIVSSNEEFRKLKQAMRKSGIVTNFAIQQILPELIESNQRSTKELESHESSKDSNGHKFARNGNQGNYDIFSLEKDEIGAFKWKKISIMDKKSFPIRQRSMAVIARGA